MFMKQYNYKPRSGSQSSQGTGSGASVTASPPKDNKAPGVQSASPGRRRSSANEKFAGLAAYKRGSEDHGERRASIAEQKPGSQGILGGMWHSFTKGT